MSENVFGSTSPMAGAQGATGPTGPTSATPHRLDFTGAIVNSAGASQEIRWESATLAAADRIVAVRSGVPVALQFSIADPTKTIWIEVLNDNGDTIYQRAIDIAHYTPDTSTNGTGSLPLVVGPYDPQGATTYLIQVRTDAASLGLVNDAVGEIFVELEIVTMAATVTIDPTPVFP